MPSIVFRFRRTSGSGRHAPSVAMTEALCRLGEAAEMQPLISEANKCGKSIVIEVFQNRNGQPIVIHFTKEKAQ